MNEHFYSAFGGRLKSSIELPELRAVEPGPVRWAFQVVDALPEMHDAALLGEDPIYGSVSARLYRHASGYRITIDDTGSYDLLDDCREILWQPTPDPWWDFGRSHLIGRVLATALQLSGTVTLHGSAVQMTDGVVGFLAPKHFGKSTLAMMLFRSGARFVTDDALPVTPSAPVLASPGIHSLRVHAGDDATQRLLGLEVNEAAGRDGKIVLPPLSGDRVLDEPAPLAAIYFLVPRPAAEAEAPVSRRKVPGITGAMRLVSQCKIGAMLGPAFAGQLLDASIAIASTVPVYELAVVRDLERLPEVVEQLAEWHGMAPSLAMAAGG